MYTFTQTTMKKRYPVLDQFSETHFIIQIILCGEYSIYFFRR